MKLAHASLPVLVVLAMLAFAPSRALAAASVLVDCGFSGYIYCEYDGWPYGNQYYPHENADAQWGASHPLTEEKRGFMSFDTYHIIPAGSTIRKVELYYAHNICYSSGPGVPVQWGTMFYIGRFLGGDVNAGDWNMGTYTARQDWYGGLGDAWIDLGPTAVTWFQQYGREGWTDIRLKDFSASWPGDWTAIPESYIGGQGKVIPDICRLKITYDAVPVSAAAKDGTPATWGSIKTLYQ